MMDFMRLLLCVALLWAMAPACCWAQAVPDSLSRYQRYLLQAYRMMNGSRGMPPQESLDRLALLRDMAVTSDSSLNQVIAKLYPPHNPDSVAVVFYTFQNDQLACTLFVPGQPFEQVTHRMTGKELLRLQADVVRALRISKQAAHRAPQLRGAAPVPTPDGPKISLDGALAAATRILLPFKTSLAPFRHLVFIPAYNIGTFPLHLLQPFGSRQYLIERCSYSLALGLNDFLKSRQEFLLRFHQAQLEDFLSRGNSQKGLAFGPRLQVKFALTYPLIVANPTYPTGGRYFFPSLPGAEREAAAVLPYARQGYKMLQGGAAVKDSVLRYLGRADVLYLASHGVASTTHAMDSSYVVLSGPDPYLTARQVQSLRGQHIAMPELVVLSACQTGLGQADAVGTVGLARAFLLAGATDVVMSLWNVDDDATAFLMGRFVHHLVAEPYTYGPAEPLRKAMLDCRAKYPNPMHWASFTVAGMAY
jgi:CHAT domain-containing protein